MPDQNDVLRAIMSVLQNPAVQSAIASSPFSVPSIQQSGPAASMAMGARGLTPNVPGNWVNEFESAASQAPAVANNVKESLANLFQRGGRAPSGRNVWVDQRRFNQIKAAHNTPELRAMFGKTVHNDELKNGPP
ncbi:MAG: hypothetical protein KGL39_43920, partial [Patescibacteria group bacterium]|nr:hypothetical protein [Patescibacteria group bacterium]